MNSGTSLNDLFDMAVLNCNDNLAMSRVLQNIKNTINKEPQKFEEIENRLQQILPLFGDEIINNKIQEDKNCDSIIGLFTKLYNVQYETLVKPNIYYHEDGFLELTLALRFIFKNENQEIINKNGYFSHANLYDTDLIKLSITNTDELNSLSMTLDYLPLTTFDYLFHKDSDLESDNSIYQSIKNMSVNRIKELTIKSLNLNGLENSKLFNVLSKQFQYFNYKYKLNNSGNSINKLLVHQFISQWLMANSALLKPLIESGFVSIMIDPQFLKNYHFQDGKIEIVSYVDFGINEGFIVSQKQRNDFSNALQPFLFGEMQKLLPNYMMKDITEAFCQCFFNPNTQNKLTESMNLIIELPFDSFENLEQNLTELHNSVITNNDNQKLIELRNSCKALFTREGFSNELLDLNIFKKFIYSVVVCNPFVDKMPLAINQIFNYIFSLRLKQKEQNGLNLNSNEYCDFSIFINEFPDKISPNSNDKYLSLERFYSENQDFNDSLKGDWGFLNYVKQGVMTLFKINIENQNGKFDNVYFINHGNSKLQRQFINGANFKTIDNDNMFYIFENLEAFVIKQPIVTTLSQTVLPEYIEKQLHNKRMENYQVVEMNVKIKSNSWHKTIPNFGCSLRDLVFDLNIYNYDD